MTTLSHEEKLEHYIKALQALSRGERIAVCRDNLWRFWAPSTDVGDSRIPHFDCWDDFRVGSYIKYRVALFRVQKSDVYYTLTKAPYYYKETEQSPEFVRWVSEEQTVEC